MCSSVTLPSGAKASRSDWTQPLLRQRTRPAARHHGGKRRRYFKKFAPGRRHNARPAMIEAMLGIRSGLRINSKRIENGTVA